MANKLMLFNYSSDGESPPRKHARPLPLHEAVFTREEQMSFYTDMLDIVSEVASYLWDQLDPRLRALLEWDESHILHTLARSVTRNHGLYTLHQKHGRDVMLPDRHRILHAPGSHLYEALKK